MQTYEPRNVAPVEAVQWDGSRHQAQKILVWIENVGYRAEYVTYGPGWPDRIQFTDSEGITSVEPGDWIVKKTIKNPHDSEAGDITLCEVMTPFDFEQQYKEPDA